MELKLWDGYSMPIVGLGTWNSKSEDVKTAIRTALDSGYVCIDSAAMYGNEADIGEVLQEYIKSGKRKREDLYIVTKLPPLHTNPKDVSRSLDQSLSKLKLDYVDLYLMHLPTSVKNKDPNNDTPQPFSQCIFTHEDIVEVWKEMEKLVDSKKTKSIGVSNFNSDQMERICKNARILPVTNQVECHIYFKQTELESFCKKWNVVLTAYAPIGSPGRPVTGFTNQEGPVLIQDPVVCKIATEIGKTPAQVCMRYLIQRGIAVIPKSITPARIKENIGVLDFTLNDKQMSQLSDIKTSFRYFKMWAIESHKEYPLRLPY